MKTCPKCGASKPWSAYSIDRSKANGHVARCKACVAKADNERHKASYDKNKHATNERRRHRYASDPDYAEKIRQGHAKHRAQPDVAEKKRQASAQWRQRHPERHRQNALKWAKKNPDKAIAIGAKKRAAKTCAIPAWADFEKINAVYAEAAAMRALGIEVQVDHIVPLQGKTVMGLHVHTNLRLLLASDNAAKGNRHWPDMP